MKLLVFKGASMRGALVAAAVFLSLAPLVSSAAEAKASSAHPRTIRWYVVHARDYKEYNDMLLSFAKHLSERTGGALNVEFNYSGIGGGWRDSAADVDGYKQVLAGTADMTQLGAAGVGASVVGAPFLFRNYDHAEAVWRGPIGRKMLASITRKSGGKVEALAFTYSGGFRALVGRRSVQSADDVKGARILTGQGGGGVEDELLLALGAQRAVVDDVDFPTGTDKVAAAVRQVSETLSSGKMDLFSVEINGLAYMESKYNPPIPKPMYVNLTNHSMVVTSMLANEHFLASLEPGLRKVLVEETQNLALAERRLSAELANRNLEAFAKNGHTIVPFPKEAQQGFKQAGEAVRRKHPDWTSIIREVEAASEIPLLAKAASSSKGSSAD